MPKLLLLAAAMLALLTVVATPAPRAEPTMSLAPASPQVAVEKLTLVEARTACTHRRVCCQGAGGLQTLVARPQAHGVI